MTTIAGQTASLDKEVVMTSAELIEATDNFQRALERLHWARVAADAAQEEREEFGKDLASG